MVGHTPPRWPSGTATVRQHPTTQPPACPHHTWPSGTATRHTRSQTPVPSIRAALFTRGPPGRPFSMSHIQPFHSTTCMIVVTTKTCITHM
ncbi:hypothetical protein CONPUDRAFT_160413 [Coniophora puteana RWD-64-598 SS2]|uniref:Uncharacterized protein n=1 Tax=Coniophora puteana (strain RWD-64-598) TaxID=741705 RepID=R7SCX4_CONPW|nr:uncharacterized protein CONPUDRAFT_160413 [Coniophora puteana RWD-64-598 SS2]EIW74026.1 hypothetical protein CONPUDRAFT_160413 [Coniophora puteana RWD-64-598 SS2]